MNSGVNNNNNRIDSLRSICTILRAISLLNKEYMKKNLGDKEPTSLKRMERFQKNKSSSFVIPGHIHTGYRLPTYSQQIVEQTLVFVI